MLNQLRRRRDEGFTLIELLIVIVILGILATIVVFAVRGITDRGTKSACAADYATLSTAVEAYQAQYGIYPATQTALVGAGFLHSASTKYDVTGSSATGSTITVIAGGGCS
jgi:general secretion pathway protein G